MNFLIFGDLFTFSEGNAGANRVYAYARGFNENGINVHIVCFENKYLSLMMLWLTIFLVSVNKKNMIHIKSIVFLGFLEFPYGLTEVQKLFLTLIILLFF